MTETVAKATTLSDLGYADGLVLQEASVSRSVYFPLPANTEGATLQLSFAASAVLDASASLTVLANGVPLATVLATPPGGTDQISVPAKFTHGAFLQLAFIPDLTDQPTGDASHCYDSDTTADWLVVQSNTSLTPNMVGQEGVGDLWRMASAPLMIAMPPEPNLPDVETALILSTALVERGIAPYFTNDPTQARILIKPAAQALTASTQPDGKMTQIVVPNAAAARALVAASLALRHSLGRSQASAILALQTGGPPRSLSFGMLGLGPMTVPVMRDTRLDLPLPLSDLPVGQHAVSIVLYGQGMALPPGQSEIISFELGGNIIWSHVFTDRVVLDGTTIPLPQRMLASGAKVQLHFVRLVPGSSCTRLMPLNFTLDDDSRLLLTNGFATPIRFAGFTVAGNGPVPVLTDLLVCSPRIAPSLM